MKTIIKTDNAPAPIGPYSQAVLSGNMLFISGQVAIVPETGSPMLDDIQSETHQVMKNITAILKEAGMDMSHVVKASIFLMDMGQFSQVNAVYGSYFKSDFPARETIQVSKLPLNVNVEISMIAIK